MPACQISFSAFALAAQQAATFCTPPVIDAAPAVVAHPLAADGGECTSFYGVFSRPRGLSYSDTRSDAWLSELPVEWAGGCMDAPRDYPSGSHSACVLGSRVMADAFVCRFGV